MSMIALPTNLAPVASIGDTRDSGGRFSLRAVYVEVKATDRPTYAADGHGPPAVVTDHSYRVSATDTKSLLVVEGPCGTTDDVPGLAGVRNAPNSATSALVPLKTFAETFKDAAKATKRTRPDLRQVFASLAPEQATFGYTDCETERVQATPLVAGRFPPTKDIIDSTRKADGATRFSVDAKRFADMLKTLATFCHDESSFRVDIEVRDGNKPILLTVTNRETGQTVTGLVMPLSD